VTGGDDDEHLHTDLVRAPSTRAVAMRGVDKLILHADRG
jgi:hypothetical protein